MTLRLLARPLFSLFFLLHLVVDGQAQTVSTPPGEPVHFFNGKGRVDYVLALDEFQLEPRGQVQLNARRLKSADNRIQKVVQLTGPRRTLSLAVEAATDSIHLDALSGTIQAQMGDCTRLAVLYPPATERSELYRKTLTRHISVQLKAGLQIGSLASRYNLTVVKKLDYSPDTWILEVQGTSLLEPLTVANRIYENEPVQFCIPLLAGRVQKRYIPNDSHFPLQWHLLNTGSQVITAITGEDINVVDVWDKYQGTGVNIGLVDDGLQVDHPDLAENARTDLDIDINYRDDDPSPNPPGDFHGTCCAGVAAARGDNGIGVTGAAYKAGLVGIRLISADFSDTDAAQAYLHQSTQTEVSRQVHVSSNSWGDPDDGFSKNLLSPIEEAAFQEGVTVGRGGKGIIYFWAGGNGGCVGDRVDYDSRASSRYTIAVGASAADGDIAFYSEPGASLFVNTGSEQGSCVLSSTQYGITTTSVAGLGDLDENYSTQFGGTSSATPLAAGVAALMLEANPNLTWRDVQHIFASTSTQNRPEDEGWLTNGAGHKFNHKFGFGRVNAKAAVEAALTWTNVPAEAVPLQATDEANIAIPDEDPDSNPQGISRPLTVAGFSSFRTEAVEVTVRIEHPCRGDLTILLISPSGTVSTFAEPHDDSHDNYDNWVFTSVVNWGENPNGTWVLKVIDKVPGRDGTLLGWNIAVHGYLGGPPDTPTPSPTPTQTFTTGPTPTPTDTPTVTLSPTVTLTPTITNTPTLTYTFDGPTYTPTGTPTLTPTATSIVVCTEILLDGGFEERSSGNPSWKQASLNFGTPVVEDLATAHTGAIYALFGAYAGQEIASLEQTVTIPRGDATLNYYLVIDNYGANPSDMMRIFMDGVTLAEYDPGDEAAFVHYTPVQIDVSGFADGGNHVVRFECTVHGSSIGFSSFSVDDVSLKVCPRTDEDPTPTPTASLSPTPTPSETAIPTPTPTATDTSVPTPTWTGTPSATPTERPSAIDYWGENQ